MTFRSLIWMLKEARRFSRLGVINSVRHLAALPQAGGDIRPNETIRNIGISAHIDSGKTTLTERILFYTGKLEEMHEVRGKDKVGAKMDFMELERQRGITIQSAATYTSWKGTNINIIDTPGHVDFTIEVERALRVLDGAVLVLCAVGGVQSQTYTVTRQMKRYNVPFVGFINKLDRLGADHNRVISQLKSKLGLNCALYNIPIGLEQNNKGLIDLVSRKAIYFEEPQGLNVVEKEVPDNMKEEVEAKRQELIEAVADGDDILGELFLEEKPISNDDLEAAIRRSCLARKFFPVLCGTALKNKGVQKLLDAAVTYLPNPSQVDNVALLRNPEDESESKIQLSHERSRSTEKPFIALAFKLEAGRYGQLTYFRIYQGHLKRGDYVYNSRTGKKVRVSRLVRMHADEMEDIGETFAGDIVATFGMDCATGDTFVSEKDLEVSMESMFVPEPVVSMSLRSADNKTSDNFSKALKRFAKEDPTFTVAYDYEAKETVISGMGELHLEIYSQRMANEYNTPCVLGKPRVAFRETIVKPFSFDYWHRKQHGGRGEYARVIGLLEPLPPEEYMKLDFVDNCSGANVPKNYMTSIKKGFEESCLKGPLTGHKVTGVRFRLTDGHYHIVDSSDLAFNNCTRFAMKQAYDEGRWQILEPIMLVETTVPIEFQGAVLGLLSKRGALIISNDRTPEFYTSVTEVPLNNMFGFIGELRGCTQGKGEYTMEFKKYTAALAETQDELVRIHRESQGLDQKSEKKRKKA